MLSNIYAVLKIYEKEGKLKLSEGTLLPVLKQLSYNPNEEIENVGKLLSANECLYTYKDAAHYVIFSDLNEVLLPRLSSYYDEFSHLVSLYPKAGSFQFNWAVSAAPQDQLPSSYDVTLPLKNVLVKEVIGFGTPVVIPQKVNKAFDHFPMNNWIYDQHQHVPLDRNQSWVVKYIFPVYNPALRNISIPLYFQPPTGFYFKMMQDFKLKVKKRARVYNHFKSLPQHKHFQPQMEACLRIQQLRSVPYTCVNQRKCLPKFSEDIRECTVLKRRFNYADFGANRHIYSSGGDEFHHEHSCLIY
ncbi:unnamed protein product [Bursaphelenchus okinawaensis]|uniref:Glycosyltransferase family 92 protein n=1 Tax=Bursaphelenchus okinawaensis TaxID=465554 RepID=A0A811L8P6_9BILA|nr:unnamed protein product [Bursaphelenchus okinawaensis]CAG9118405.1 unnamed protein product [Bursaphelenchus okinawaensis]